MATATAGSCASGALRDINERGLVSLPRLRSFISQPHPLGGGAGCAGRCVRGIRDGAARVHTHTYHARASNAAFK
ncbi:unnamed protein product [Lampetra planeri]